LSGWGSRQRTGCRVTTFDLSPRVNAHLEAARQRARDGGGYVLQLPRDFDAGWRPELLSYWQRFGDRIGEPVKAVATPPGLNGVQVRAMRIRPSVVLAVVPEDLNIVLQRFEPLRVEDQFDLVIATNVLVYYDVFEQSLALVNAAKMLRPGGVLLSNNTLPDWPGAPAHRHIALLHDVLHVDGGRLTGHRDRLLHRPDLELGVDVGGKRTRQLDPSRRTELKPVKVNVTL